MAGRNKDSAPHAKTMVSAKLTPEEHHELRRMALDMDTNIRQIANKAIREWMAKFRKKPTHTAGRV